MTTLSSELDVYPISSENISTKFQNIQRKTCDILEKWIVISLQTDTNECQTMNENLIKQYCDVANDIKLFNCANRCVDFVTDLFDEKVCLILRTSIAKTLLPLIYDLSQLTFIYIFRDNENANTLPINNWTKIKGSFSNMVEILYHFKQSIRKSEYDLMSISIVSLSTVDNINELDPSFMYSQLLKDSLLKIHYDKSAKSEFINHLRAEYANQSLDLKRVNIFDQNYSDKSPVWWYTKELFIYGPLNRALRTQNTEIIVRMGFFLQDLHREIERLHQEQPRDKMLVYRGQAMIKNDFRKLQKNRGGLLSFNNFLSTSTDKDVSFLLAESSSLQENSFGIVFEIEINPLISSAPFASLEKLSQFETEKEILFSMHTIFRIDNITNINRGVWQVNLTLTDDDDQQLKQVTESIRQEIRNGSANKSLGYLLFRMGEYDTAEKIYKKFLTATSDNDIRSRLDLYNMLGGIEYAKSAYPAALQYYQQILDMCPLPDDCNDFDLTNVYNNMALLHHSMGDYSTASEFYEIIAEIREGSLTCSSIDLGSMYNNIAVVNTSAGCHSIALKYFQKSLNILEVSLPPTHPDLAFIYNNIGMINNAIGERKLALLYFEKALEVQKKSLPPTHLLNAGTLNNLAATNHWLGQHQTAIEYYQSALKILETDFSSKRSDLAIIHNNIGQLYKTLGNYNEALPYYLKAIEIQEAISSSDDPKLAVFYINMAMLYKLMGDYSATIEHLKRAQEIQETSLPATHPDFARIYNSFGIIYQAKEEFFNALHHYKKALNIQETAFGLTHPDLACIYNNMAGVELHLGQQYEYIALEHINQVLSIQEAHLPPNHPEIGRTYFNMGTIHMKMKNYPETEKYFEKAFKIYKETLPLQHPDFGKFYMNLGMLRCMMEKFPTAKKYLEKARGILEAVLPPDHPELETVLKNIAKVDQMMSLYGRTPWNFQFT